jgi:hypothetical protein
MKYGRAPALNTNIMAVFAFFAVARKGESSGADAYFRVAQRQK